MSTINRRSLLLAAASIGALGAARADGVSGGIANGVNDGTFGGLVNGGFFPLTGSTDDLWFAAGRYAGGTLANMVSVARAAPATSYATNADGTLSPFAINTPRIGIGTGLLIEEARTNLILQSGNLASATWNKGNGGVVAPVVTGNFIAAPDGTLTASKVVYPAISSAGDYTVVSQAFDAGGSATNTISIYLRGDVGGEQVYLIATPDAVSWVKVLATLTTSWQRFTVSGTMSGVWFYELGIDLRDAGQSAKSAQTVYAWGGQAEQGPSALSQVPTTTVAVTRAADVPTLIGAALTLYLATNLSVVASFNVPAVGALGPAIISGESSNRLMFINESGLVASIYHPADSPTVLSTANTYTLGTNAKVGFATSLAGRSVVLNGGTVATDGQWLVAPSISALLGDGDGNRWLNGYLQRITLWNSRLADAALQGFTA